MAKEITICVEINIDDKYCGIDCHWLKLCPPGCRLFKKSLDRCLGGGPLRCQECLDAKETE